MGVCCFVTQEDQNGVVTMIREIILHWPTNNVHELMILCSKNHWAYDQFLELYKKKKIKLLIKCPFSTTQDIRNLIRNTVKLPILSKILRGIIRLLRPIFLVWYVFRLRRLFLEYNVSALFSHNGGYPGGELNRLAVIAARLAGIQKNYMIIHNYPVPTSKFMSWLQKKEDSLISFSTKKIISVSRSCAEAIQRQRFPNIFVDVIPNGFHVSPHEDISENEDFPSWSKEKPIIFFVGQLHPRKGLDVLFDALAGIKGKFTMVLYGSGTPEFTQYLKQKVKLLGYSHQVYFEGFNYHVFNMIKYCNVLVLPSVAYESFGMVLLEAMYWKKPVICSDFGGMKEVVQHEHTGLIVPAGNMDSLKNAIQFVIDCPHIAESWGNNGYERLKKFFNISLIAEKYSKLI